MSQVTHPPRRVWTVAKSPSHSFAERAQAAMHKHVLAIRETLSARGIETGRLLVSILYENEDIGVVECRWEPTPASWGKVVA